MGNDSVPEDTRRTVYRWRRRRCGAVLLYIVMSVRKHFSYDDRKYIHIQANEEQMIKGLCAKCVVRMNILNYTVDII